jgi:hypothetical protein
MRLVARMFSVIGRSVSVQARTSFMCQIDGLGARGEGMTAYHTISNNMATGFTETFVRIMP